MSNKWLRVLIALGIGSAMIHFAERLLGVRVELFWGLQTFNFNWMLVVFVVPFLTGWVIAWVYGIGGKMVAHFPPLIVNAISYFQTIYVTGVPRGAELNPIGWWGLYVILTMEFCAFGAFLGELHLQKAVSKRRRERERLARTSAPDGDAIAGEDAAHDDAR